MAVMTSQQRAAGWAELMQTLSDNHDPTGVIKGDLRASFDATDQWVSDNAASYNAALPVAARNGLTTTQKALQLMIVLRRRYLNGT